MSARCVCPLWSFLFCFVFLRVVRGGDKGEREIGFDDGYFGMSLTVLLFFLLLFAVTLSKTKKKGKVQKESLVKSVRDCLDEYSSVYVFSFENMRNTKFKEFKEDLKSSSRYKFFFSRSPYCVFSGSAVGLCFL